jgi:CubicO group peptidase (beta-lactamase class C family)
MTMTFARRSALRLVLLLAACPLVLAETLTTGSPAETGVDPERLGRLRPVLQSYVDDGQLAGAVTLVARNGKIVYHEAVGMRDREARAPMQRDTLFRIASQTKAIVSVAAMTLVEEGALSLTDPVSKYIPEFRETTVAVPREDGSYEVVPAKRQITIRDLLTHTSGFDYGMGLAADRWAAAGIQGWYFADRDEPIAATVARMAQLPAQAHPGERWVYGYNTDILGVVIERVTGKPLDVVLLERIFQPLQMRDTHFYVPEEKRERLAVVYSHREGRIERAPATSGSESQGNYVDGPRKSFSGGAGLISTAYDYARFLQMLLNGGELDGERILGRKTIELMTTNHLGSIPFNAGQGFGLGFSIVEDVGARGTPGSVGEFGWGGAYHSTYWVDPEEELIVVHLTQLIPAGDVDDFAKVRALVYQALVD